MIFLFYISGLASIITTMCVLLHKNIMHSLLYLILSLLCISLNLFSIGAFFASMIEIIVYAGAIMVLFMFAIMMIDLKTIVNNNSGENAFLSIKSCVGIIFLMSSLLVIILYILFGIENCFINTSEIIVSVQTISIALFGPYMLIVEMASFLLLGALISVLHIVQSYKKDVNNFNYVQLRDNK